MVCFRGGVGPRTQAGGVPHLRTTPPTSSVDRCLGARYLLAFEISVPQSVTASHGTSPSVSFLGPFRATITSSSLKPPRCLQNPLDQIAAFIKETKAPTKGCVWEVQEADKAPAHLGKLSRMVDFGMELMGRCFKIKLGVHVGAGLWNRSPQDNPYSPGAVGSQEKWAINKDVLGPWRLSVLIIRADVVPWAWGVTVGSEGSAGWQVHMR